MKIASYAQEAIWISSQFAPDCPLYNETVTVRFPAGVDPQPMETALRALIARHDILRTAFLEDATGVPHQRLTDSAPLVLRWSDLSTSPMPDRERTAARLAELDVAEPFDLARPSLLRARLVRFGPADTRLYLNLHHLIFDAHTLHHVLLPDLRAFLEGRPPPHPLAAANHLATGKLPPRTGNDHPVASPYGMFRTSDGEIAIAPPGEAMYRRLLKTLDAEIGRAHV